MNSEKNLLETFLDNTLISAIIGAAGMTCRLLLSENKEITIWIAIRHIIAAMLTAVMVGHAASDYISTESTRYALVGVAGYAAPEVLDACLKLVRKQIEKITKKG